MNDQVRELLFRTEAEFPDDAARSTLLGYADGMVARLESMHAIERAEGAILDEVVGVVLGKHPAIPEVHGSTAAQSLRRDQAMVLRYAAMAMLVHDEGFIRDRLAVWLRTVMLAVCKPEQVLVGYRALLAACEHHLTQEDAAAIAPYIRVMIDEFEPYTRSVS